MKPRIFVIGLDAATMDLIEPWADELPALAGLMREGASSQLISTPNMHSASAWTSILTGLNPGRHGLFVFSDRDFATNKQLFFKGGDRAGEIICSYLARQAVTSGLLNVPMTYPAECQGGGFMISGLDSPSLNEKAFCPAQLRAELFTRFPDYIFTPTGLGDLMSAGRIDEAIQSWIKLIETQTAAAEYLLQSRPVDFFMTVYTASDWAGHNLWKYFDTSHPEYDEGKSTRYGDAMLSIYRALDRAIARLLNHTDRNTQVYIISDHGMGRHTGASYHLVSWLEANGYMVRKTQGRSRASLLNAGRRAAQSLLPVALKEKIKSGVGRERIKRLESVEKDSFYSSIDWQRTRAYAEPGRHVININLAGRNHQGIVAESDYYTVCQRITEDLNRWTDARGERVVERVAHRDDVYSGPFHNRASDLYVYWSATSYLGKPPKDVRARGFWWSGDHRPEGILICKGPGIRAGARPNAPRVYDLVPTIMYLAGLTVPDRLDGRVIREACSDEFLAANSLRLESGSGTPTGESTSLSKFEEQMIEEKLRGLGYM